MPTRDNPEKELVPSSEETTVESPTTLIVGLGRTRVIDGLDNSDLRELQEIAKKKTQAEK
jgi:hypothetical protein